MKLPKRRELDDSPGSGLGIPLPENGKSAPGTIQVIGQLHHAK